MASVRLPCARRHLALAAALCCSLSAPAAFAGVVTGQVRDASGVRALQGAALELVELGRRAEAGADGSFRFVDVAPGRYTLRVSYAGAATQELAVEVSGEGVVRSDVSLAPAEGTALLDTVLVIGQRASLSSSLSRQRAADGVESVLTRDAIGQFPDQNVAESVRRALGVNVLNDQGEGRFVAVRGLAPDFNAASLNGVRVPAPEADVRGVALDVLPAELIESIEIRKSLTPDMDADTLGASIDIQTTSAFDREKPFTSVTLEGSYNELRDEVSPKGAVDFSRRLTPDFGVAGGLSFYQRKFSTDNVEADDWTENDDGVIYAETLEYRDYDVERERLGGTLSLDWRASELTTLYLKSVYSRFEDQESRARLIFEVEEASAADGDTVGFLSDDGEIGVTRDLKDRNEVQTITSLATGGRSYFKAWTFDYQLAWSKADEEDKGSLDPMAFSYGFEEPGELGVAFDYSAMTRPRYTVLNGADAFHDPATYEFDQLDRTTLSLSEDEETSARIDIAREFAAARGSVELKFGAKARQRDKTYDLQQDVYDGFDGDFTLADVLGSQSYGLADIEPIPGSGVRSFFNDNRALFENAGVDTAFESAVADYDVSEDINAGYVQGRYDNGRLRLIGGVRLEQTDNTLRGNTVELVEEGAERDGVVLDEDTVFVSASEYTRDYEHWLPSATLRFEAMPDLVLRASVYRSLLRPGIGQIAPRVLVEENSDGEREGEFGNPELEALSAWSGDVTAEWYFASKGVLQLGYFHKDIENFIVNVEFEEVTFNGVYADEAVIPANGDDATVDGVEFGYSQALSRLPAPFDGLLLGFNTTWIDTEATIDGRSIPLPAASETTWNALLGYERGRVSLRLAAAYRDEYLDELGGDASDDRWVQDHLQWDLSGKLRVTEQLQLIAELINITDEPYVAYRRGPGGDQLLQYEEYSYTAKLGLRATF